MSESAKKTLLLVEDEVILAMTEKMQLEKYGYAVRTVNTGEKAVDAVKTMPEIELVLMDINLGDGIDGTDAAAIILKDHDIPIIFVSSHSEREIVEKTEKITSYGYVVKNSSITVLDASIKMAFKLFDAKKKEIEKEKALSLSEEKYRLISENTSDGIIHFSQEGKIDFVSPSYLKQLGYSESEELGRDYNSIASMVHPDDRDILFPSIYDAIEKKKNGLTYFYRAKHANGRYIWREDNSSFIYDASGKYLGSYVVCRDITDRKLAEERCQMDADNLRALNESISAMLALPDLKSILNYIASFMQKKYQGTILLVVSIDEVRSDSQLVSVKGIENSIFDTLLKISGFNPIEKHFRLEPTHNELFRLARFVKFRGGLADFSTSQFPEWAAKKIEKILGLDRIFTIGIVRDSDLLAAIHFLSFSKETVYDSDFIEAFTRQAGAIIQKKMADDKVQSLLLEKEHILKEVNHRIKNNMVAISSLLSIHENSISEPSAVMALHEAGNRIRSMSLLHDKLYRLTGFNELSVKEYLNSLVDEVIENFPNSKNVKIEKYFEDFMLDAKQVQLLGIMINELITNIMKYAFRDHETGLIALYAKSTNDHVVITVQDNGVGMPETIDFEHSTGFGLQLVQAMTKQLNGIVRIERGNGTKIILELNV